MSDNLKVEVTARPSEEDAAVIDAGLTSFNEQQSALADVRPLAVITRDASDTVIAGLLGRTWGLCGEIQVVWVDEKLRGQDIGTRLVRQAEAEFQSRAVETVFLETFSFQAPEFYEKLGYQPFQSVDGFPDGIRKVWFIKRLTERSTTAGD